MQLYDSFGPNPRATRMFLAEKGITIPSKTVDLMGAENRRPPYTDRNPGGQVPALELDNGKCIGETVAIWEYLEEKHPTPALIGTTAEERAETRQWQRRVELQITEHSLQRLPLLGRFGRCSRIGCACCPRRRPG